MIADTQFVYIYLQFLVREKHLKIKNNHIQSVKSTYIYKKKKEGKHASGAFSVFKVELKKRQTGADKKEENPKKNSLMFRLIHVQKKLIHSYIKYVLFYATVVLYKLFLLGLFILIFIITTFQLRRKTRDSTPDQ